MNFTENLERQSKLFWTSIGTVLIGIIGFLDYQSGYELSFSLFYLIPIALLGWFAGKRFGVAASIISALVWLQAEIAAGQDYSHPAIGFWNSSIRLSFFIIVTLLLAMIREILKHEKELSSTDYLTGAVNARFFNEILQNEIYRYSRHKRPFTLAYIDLDNFKSVNDQFGHSAGDRVLYTVVKNIKDNLRKSDIIVRLGGDEFAVLLVETDQDGSKIVVSRVLQDLQDEMNFQNWPITFSIGAITFIDPPELADEVIKLADDLMYLVKKSGKDGIRYSTYLDQPLLIS